MRLLNHQRKHLSSLSRANTQALSSFTHLQTLFSSDLHLQISRYLHNKSGAMIYDLKSNDKDRTFSPIVRTLPQNDTGCPHILQHLSCCGSQRYPIRDPFFNMLRRSVSTYMNAWTGDDFTAYPFSSANKKDFENLYKVYIDMCLKPLLNELDFRQQGWRYEINSETGQRQIKGIVFNQMKGAYQNPDRQLYVEIANKLFKDTPFGFDSGGKPDQIVQLSYEQVKNMHSYYYHPSNMSFFYYGDSDISQNLKYLEQEYLLSPTYLNTTQDYIKKSNMLMEKMPTNVQRFHKISSYTAETPNIALTYNLGLLADAPPADVTCLNILSYLLLETNQAILYQQFIQGHLADSFGASGFNLGSILTFSVSLKNITIKSEQFFTKIQKCLEDIIQRGVDENRVQEYIRQTQLEILTPKKNQGIKYLGTCLPYMVNRLPLSNLAYVRSYLNAAVKRLKNKNQLRQLINKYFLKNEKKIVILQQPLGQQSIDPYINVKGIDIGQQTIRNQQKQLKIRQQSAASNSVQCLPKLQLKDLEANTEKKYMIQKQGTTQAGNSLRQLFVETEIPEIKFLRISFKLDMDEQQNKKLLPYLDLWKYAINQGISTKSLTNKQLSSKLNLTSNNFHVQFEKPSQSEPSKINIIFTASCLEKHVQQYLKLVKQILFQPVFKDQDIQNIFRSYRMEKIQELLDGNVMQYCLDLGSAMISQQGQVWNGYDWAVKGIEIVGQGQVPKQFGEIHQKLKNNGDLTVIQHSNKYLEGIPQKLGFNYSNKPLRSVSKSSQPVSTVSQLTPIAVTNSYNVNFCSQQYLGPKYYTKQHAEITLFIQILEQDYLHQKIRQKGGAYGARATYRDVGTIALYSYMDPYSQQTFQAFQESIHQLVNASVGQKRIQEVKIKVIGSLEQPIVPQNECIGRIYKNYTSEERRRYINDIRQASWQQIVKTGKKYLLDTKMSRILFGKDIPKGFTEQKLKIPKQQAIDV